MAGLGIFICAVLWVVGVIHFWGFFGLAVLSIILL
jgi:hypothetical protein